MTRLGQEVILNLGLQNEGENLPPLLGVTLLLYLILLFCFVCNKKEAKSGHRDQLIHQKKIRDLQKIFKMPCLGNKA